MEHKLMNGVAVTDEELERMASEFESGEWDGRLENVVLSVPRQEEATKVETFRITSSRAAVKEATKAHGITKSEFYRRAVDRELTALAN